MTGDWGLEKAWFSAVNALVEPAARKGLLLSPVCRTGAILVETTGRRSGYPHQVPLLAVVSDDFVLVATARGARSDWIRNIAANPGVRYWLGGEEVTARAVLLGAEGRTENLPDDIASVVEPMSAHGQMLGWRFAVLIPCDVAAVDSA